MRIPGKILQIRRQKSSDTFLWIGKTFSGLQTYPNLHPPPAVGVFHEGVANLCRFVPVRSSQTRAWGREFVHVLVLILGRLVQVGANLDSAGH